MPKYIFRRQGIAIGAIEGERKNFWGVFSKHPSSVLDKSRDVLEMFVTMLKRLKNIADEHADRFESEGFKVFFVMLQKELDDEYFASVQAHLEELKFRDGVLVSAELGKGNKGSNYVLRKSHDKKQSWMVSVVRVFGTGCGVK